MKTIIFFSLFFFLPIFLSAQDEDQDEKTTCGTLIENHMNQCEKCRLGEKCHTRKDLLEFCGGKEEQDVRVIDPGPSDCGCPTYGYYHEPSYSYYGNYYQPASYGGYYYNGPSYRVGFGLSIGASYYLGGSYYTGGSYYRNGDYYNNGNYHHQGGYYHNGNYYTRGNYRGQGNYHDSGNHHSSGNYNNQGSHHSQGSSNYQGHYGSRPHSRRGG